MEKLPKINSDFSISAAAITAALRSVLDSEVHRITGGFHMVVLLDSQGVISVAEDIGRHNAVDRIIGHALRNGIDLSKTFVISSGRISSEMVRKCLIANIPVIVSRSATTTLSVDIANKTGLTIIGFARGGKLNIYSHPSESPLAAILIPALLDKRLPEQAYLAEIPAAGIATLTAGMEGFGIK